MAFGPGEKEQHLERLGMRGMPLPVIRQRNTGFRQSNGENALSKPFACVLNSHFCGVGGEGLRFRNVFIVFIPFLFILFLNFLSEVLTCLQVTVMNACPDAALRLSFIVSHTLFLCWLFLPFHFPVFKKLPIKNFSEGPCSQKPRRWPFLMASCLVQGLQKSEPDHPGIYSPPW